jgi:hypothetical protein
LEDARHRIGLLQYNLSTDIIVIFDLYDLVKVHQLEMEFELESFAPCYSQSLLLADFKENHTLLSF